MLKRTLPIDLRNNQQGNLGLEFQEFDIVRNRELLDAVGVKADLVKLCDGNVQDFRFNRLIEPPPLTFELLASAPKGWESMSLNMAHEHLLELVWGDKVMPLCLWAIDVVLGYRQDQGVNPLLPERPNPERKLIILTLGRFSESSEGEYSQNVAFVEKPDGSFKIETFSRIIPHILYKKPGWDIAALCVPRSLCVMYPDPVETS